MNSARNTVVALAAGLAACGGSSGDASDDVSAYAKAAASVADYIDWRRGGADADRASRVAAPVWNGRFHDGEGPHMVDRADVARMPAMFAAPRVTSIQSFLGDFAVARIDDWRSPSTMLLTLFFADGVWRVATEATAPATCVERAGRYDADIAASAVLDVLGGYYAAVDADDAGALDAVHHEDWRMKNHDGDAVASEGKAAFATRLEGDTHAGYANDRQIADVQLIYNCMAFVRIDKPSSGGVTVFTFYRTGEDWRIVDKAWTSPK